MLLNAYPILLQLANVLPRKTVVDLSRGSRKQLRKKTLHKRKAVKAQSGSKRARVTMEEISDEQAGGLSRSSSMMTIESLVRKVHNVHYPLSINLIHMTCMYSQQENETQFTISMSLSTRTRKDKLVTPVTSTTSATTGIAKLSW
jgi:hypothetical protein